MAKQFGYKKYMKKETKKSNNFFIKLFILFAVHRQENIYHNIFSNKNEQKKSAHFYYFFTIFQPLTP